MDYYINPEVCIDYRLGDKYEKLHKAFSEEDFFMLFSLLAAVECWFSELQCIFDMVELQKQKEINFEMNEVRDGISNLVHVLQFEPFFK